MVDYLPLVSFETNIYIAKEVLKTYSFQDKKHNDVFSIDNSFDIEKKPIIEILPKGIISEIELINTISNVSVKVSLSSQEKITIESDVVYVNDKEVSSTFTGMFTVKENSINSYTVKVTPAETMVDIDFKVYMPEESNIQYFVQNISINENNEYHTVSGGIIRKRPKDFVLTNTSYTFSINQLWYNSSFLLDKDAVYRIKLKTEEGLERTEPLTLHLCGCKFEELGYEERDGEATRKNISGVCCDIFKN